jgi:YYY domain-containing protein
MMVVLLIAVIAAAGWFVAVPLFEFVLGVLLTVPLVWLLCARVAGGIGIDVVAAGISEPLYWLVFFGVVGAAYGIFGIGGKAGWRLRGSRVWSDLYPFAVLFTFFSVALYFCSLWPDFFAMGERLRDYALVAGVINSPVEPREPWLEGYTLNYYIFWYRFGAMLAALLKLPVWEVYNILVALAISLYGAVIFQLLRVVVGIGITWSTIGAVMVSFGSNYAGMRLWRRREGGGFEHDDFWWGPSRVIDGAINEFPAWSFLLGDAHPHYLNLVTLPLLILLLYRILTGSCAATVKQLHIVGLVVCGALFLKGSNAWEVPIWLGVVAMVLATAAVQRGDVRQILAELYVPRQRWLSEAKTQRGVLVSVVWVILIGAAYLSGAHIHPEKYPVTLVRAPIPVTETSEFLVHFGVQCAVVLVAGVAWFLQNSVLEAVCVAGILGMALLYDRVGVLLCGLLGLHLVRVLRMKGTALEASAWRVAVCGGLAIAVFGLLMIPEIAFLNDPYGGKDERMNTIFKIYMSSWGLLSVVAIGAAYELWITWWRGVLLKGERLVGVELTLTIVFGVLCIVQSGRFFVHTIPLRKTEGVEQRGFEGLASVERQYPGSAEVIRVLRTQPRGRVLEAQGNPYSTTTFVSTLAGQPSYLGWRNHVDLLVREHGESARREQITQNIYEQPDCQQRRGLAVRENIAYVVVGALEQAKYPDLSSKDFSCFTKVGARGQYALYGTGLVGVP